MKIYSVEMNNYKYGFFLNKKNAEIKLLEVLTKLNKEIDEDNKIELEIYGEPSIFTKFTVLLENKIYISNKTILSIEEYETKD